jgi:acyl-CoA synthetase (AMP-forming)/AMP-acid ligase II
MSKLSVVNGSSPVPDRADHGASTLQAALYEQMERASGKRALALVDSNGQFSWQSLGALYERGLDYSAALVDRGLRPGDVCIVAVSEMELCATLFIATLLLGAVPLLIAPSLLSRRTSAMTSAIRPLIRKTRARLMIVPAGMDWAAEEPLPGAGQSPAIVPDTSLRPLRGTRIPRIAPAHGSIAVLQMTSGHAGVPRICVWTQASLAAGLRGARAAMGLREGDVGLSWTPLTSHLGLVNLLLFLTSGIPLALMSTVDVVWKPGRWLRGLHSTGATMTWAPNYGFALAVREILDEEVDGVRLDRVRAYWNSTERVHLDTLEAFHARFSPLGVRFDALKTHYSCAESAGGATFSDPGRDITVERVDGELLRKRGVARVVSDPVGDRASVSVVGVGRPYPGLQVWIRSRTGRLLEDGQVGEVVLDTPSLMREYLGHSRDTHRVLRGGHLRTGELGYLRGGELFWVGYLQDPIVVGGRKLDPRNVERVLERIPLLRPARVLAFGIDDAEHGTQRVVVTVELGAGATDPHQVSAVVRDHVRTHFDVTVDDVLLLSPGTLPAPADHRRRHRLVRHLYQSGRFRDSILSPEAMRA